jgi:hypothetical protein
MSTPPCTVPLPEGCTYISIRPTVTIGEYTASAPVADYQEVQLEIGLPSTPTKAHAFFDKAEDAIDTALAFKAQRADLSLWYNGAEDLFQFSDWRTFSARFAEWDDDWGVVEQVATGRLASDAAVVFEAADNIPLIAVAAAQVQP